MKYNVKITLKAQENLKAILQKIVKYSSSQEYGQKWKDKFKKAILSLDEFPCRYPLVKEDTCRLKGVRRMSIRPYIAYYCVIEKEKIVSVDALSHSKQNQAEILEEAYGI